MADVHGRQAQALAIDFPNLGELARAATHTESSAAATTTSSLRSGTTSERSTEAVRQMGADAVVVDGLDALGIGEAVARAEPDAIIHEMTALWGTPDFRHFDHWCALTNPLRTEGTEYLLAAAKASGVKRFVASLDGLHVTRMNTARLAAWQPMTQAGSSLPIKREASSTMAALDARPPHTHPTSWQHLSMKSQPLSRRSTPASVAGCLKIRELQEMRQS